MTLAIVDGDPFLYAACWNINNLSDAKEKLNLIFDEALQTVFAKDYVMAIGGPNNFRDTFYPLYKKSITRSKSRSNKPEWFYELKEYLSKKEGAVVTNGFEADDQVRIWSVEMTTAAKPFIVISIDKDLDCISGQHFNPKKNLVYNITEEEAEKLYWTQMLVGDQIDNIPGVRGYGPIKTKQLFNKVENSDRIKELVCRVYNEVYKDEGYQYLLANGRLLHIWRYYNDHFKFSKEKYDAAISSL